MLTFSHQHMTLPDVCHSHEVVASCFMLPTGVASEAADVAEQSKALADAADLRAAAAMEAAFTLRDAAERALAQLDADTASGSCEGAAERAAAVQKAGAGRISHQCSPSACHGHGLLTCLQAFYAFTQNCDKRLQTVSTALSLRAANLKNLFA
jgi:hypothetical protein